MSRQKVRARRRAASTDLTERDRATLTPELNDQPRGRKRARINPPSTLTNFSDATECTDQTEPPTSQTIVNQGQLTHPTAVQIAASMITQLRRAGLQLTVSNGNTFSPEGLANLFSPMTASSSTISNSAKNITIVPQPSVGVPSQNVQEHSVISILFY